MGEIRQEAFVDSMVMASSLGAKYVLDALNSFALELSVSDDGENNMEAIAFLVGEIKAGLEGGIPLVENEVRRTAPALYKMLREIG